MTQEMTPDPAQILLVVNHIENRRLLLEHLRQYYQVSVGSNPGQIELLLDQPFDLCIIDGVLLKQYWQTIQLRKHQAQPLFLPVLLITHHPDVTLMTQNLWETIDELITKPIEKAELQVRIEMLLRSRRFSLQLEAALNREREANELKSRFISMASHEFRNPLNLILGFARLLGSGRDITAEQRIDFSQRIINAGNRMVTLLDDILITIRAETGQTAFNPVAIALEPYCRQLMEEVNLSVDPTHPINFVYEGDQISARFDEPLLRQFLTNLLSNALKYSPADRPVQFRVQPQPDRVTFQIQDQGIGIAAADQPKLFNAFYRADNVGNVPGTGLGLAIVKQAVERHGGTIELESAVNVGTTFTVTLPLTIADAS